MIEEIEKEIRTDLSLSPEDIGQIILSNIILYGEWLSTSNENQANYLNESSGFVKLWGGAEADIDIETDTETEIDLTPYANDTYNPFSIHLYNGDSTGQGFIIVNMDSPSLSYNQSTSSFVLNQSVSVSSSELEMTFINRTNNQPIMFQDKMSFYGLALKIEGTSSECSLAFVTTLMTTSSIFKFLDKYIIIYIIMMSVACAISIYSSYHIIRNFPKNIEEIKTISVGSLYLTFYWEFALGLSHLAFAIVFQISYWLLVLTIFFAVSVIMLLRVFFLACRVSHYGRTHSRLAACVPFLNKILFFIFMLGYYVGIFISNYGWVLLPSSLYLTPQIIQIYLKNQKPTRCYCYNFAFAFTKIFFVGYYFLYPNNVFGNTLQPLPAYTFIGLIVLQAIVIIFQKRLVFVTKRIKTKQGLLNRNKDEEICLICYNVLRVEPELYDRSVNHVAWTLCQHKFHCGCIRSWVLHNDNCPIDRQPLQMNDLYDE